jgi:hypothetical protein
LIQTRLGIGQPDDAHVEVGHFRPKAQGTQKPGATAGHNNYFLNQCYTSANRHIIV